MRHAVITGALGYTHTGSLFGPFSAVQTAPGNALLQANQLLANRLPSQASKEATGTEAKDKGRCGLCEDRSRTTLQVAGRNDFQYDNASLKNDLNAFALCPEARCLSMLVHDQLHT